MVMQATRELPPGAYYGDDGRVYRDRMHFLGYETDPETGQQRELHDLTAREVYLSSATDPQGVYQAQKVAQARGLDFYHPQHGWLKRGRTPERERPEQMGEMLKPRRRISRPVAASPDPEPERIDAPAAVETKKGRTHGA